WVFGLGNLAEKGTPIRLFAVICVGYLGFYAPNIFISNRMGKRQHSIESAWTLAFIFLRSRSTLERLPIDSDRLPPACDW
ncbi:hypothetical protein AB9F35_36230, partial [Rhizobium leguminosarum]